MKFIFPQNYNFNTKLLGIIDYSVAIADLIWGALIFLIVNFLFKSLRTKIFLIIILVFPIMIFSVVGVDGENLLSFLSYIIKYIFKQKIYLYEKKWKKTK